MINGTRVYSIAEMKKRLNCELTDEFVMFVSNTNEGSQKTLLNWVTDYEKRKELAKKIEAISGTSLIDLVDNSINNENDSHYINSDDVKTEENDGLHDDNTKKETDVDHYLKELEEVDDNIWVDGFAMPSDLPWEI